MSKDGGYQLEYMDKARKRPSPPPKKSPDKKKKPNGCIRFLIILVQLSLIALLFGVFASIGGYIYFSNQMSDAIETVANYRGSGAGGSPRFYDRKGNLLFELTTTEKRLWLKYNEIPRDIIDAAVAAEDDTFWTNIGVDIPANVAAIVRNYRNPRRPSGGCEYYHTAIGAPHRLQL